jgi:pyruvate/2-oxoglutarate/acetoin dehydrogenase E1 component
MPRQIGMLEAIRETVAEEMALNDAVIYLGIDVRDSVRSISSGLVERFGRQRVVNTPIAESSIVGMGIGAALMGLHPISEIMFEDFAMLAMDHLYNNMGTLHYLTNGQYSVPLTVFCISGTGQKAGAGATHGQCLQPLFMSAPGISVCVPATPADAQGLLRQALRGQDPVIFSLDAMLMGTACGEPAEAGELTPFGVARVARQGRDVTVVAVGGMVPQAVASAAELSGEGVSVEIIDPRTLAPLDRRTILESVAKTGRLVVAEESRSVCGVGAEIIATVASEDPSMLKAPARRVAAPMIPIPAAGHLEEAYLPGKDDISRSIREILA